MESITRYLVQASMSSEVDTEILHRRGFNVNMRLFKSSSSYRNIVLGITMYMSKLATKEYSNYSAVSGVSGANIGIPLNLVGVRATKDFKPDKSSSITKDSLWILINPKITAMSSDTKVVSSNCGSILLSQKIKVRRYKWVEVEYYDITGRKIQTRVEGSMAYTLQHEIDHNMGILITDKEEKDDGNVSHTE